MKKDLSQKQVAMQQLLALAEDRSFDIYETSGEPAYGYRAWPLNWSEHLYGIQKCSDKEKQERLDKVLFRLSRGDLPNTVKQLKFEKLAIQLVLNAGANPNATYGREGSIFQIFMDNQKRYGALEVAKHRHFCRPENMEPTFHSLMRTLAFYLINGKAYPLGGAEEKAINRQAANDDRELVKVLVHKGIYPQREEVFRALTPIMLEDNPCFFDQERERIITQLKQAKTPVQFWATMIGQQKERE